MIPKSFDCMGFTIKVDIERLDDSGDDGNYHSQEHRISISNGATEQVQSQTFWHEWMHCALTILGYDKLNDNEQFIDQMAGLLYQLERSRKDE